MDIYKEGKNLLNHNNFKYVYYAYFKVIASIVGKSSAVIADGIHTLSDVITTVMVILGLKISNKKRG